MQETHTNLSNNFRVRANSTQLFRVITVSRGGTYKVQVAADELNAIKTDPVYYNAPPLEHPVEVRVTVLTNGSYKVDWLDRANLKNSSIRYFYDVFVHDGYTLNETSAQVFTVNGPPFIYTNSSSKMYTFAVRVRSAKGLKSSTSEMFTKLNEMEVVPTGSSVSTVAIVIPCLLTIALIGIVAFLVVRNRRLQSSFTRFTNSHYDTRSDAATFDDNSLEEEDTPQIRGFSDDEPLVIA